LSFVLQAAEEARIKEEEEKKAAEAKVSSFVRDSDASRLSPVDTSILSDPLFYAYVYNIRQSQQVGRRGS
jgi:hypothetical protein